MKAIPISLKDIIERIVSRGKIELDACGGWCDDSYLVKITSEEMINLKALSKKHPALEASVKEIDLETEQVFLPEC